MNRLQKISYWILLVIFFLNVRSTHQAITLKENETIRYSSHFPTAYATEISPLCYNDSLLYLQAFLNQSKWAYKMYQTTGLMPLRGLLNSMEEFTSSPGLFDECLSIEAPTFQGQFCSVFFKIEERMDEEKQRDGDDYTFKLPRAGFCIPSSCNSSDLRSSVSQLIARNALAINTTSFIVTITDENYCYKKERTESSAFNFDGPEIAALVLLSLLGLAVLLATLYDGWRSLKGERVDTNWKKFLICFSALENGRKVLSTKATSSDLSCLHGIRFLSATWIILFHTFVFMLNFAPMANIMSPNKHIIYEWGMQAIARGIVSIDTFFILSRLLVSYTLLRELKRSNGHFNVFSFYLHRYMRISPFYFFYLFFMSTLVVHLGTGPLWHYVHIKRESCRVDWWKHFLYIDNYFAQHPPPVECMIQSWYLAVDMQLFVLSPLFVYPLWKSRRAGLAWVIFAIVAFIGVIGSLFIIWDIPSFYTTDIKKNESYLFYYYQTFGRAPQYLVGILLGWILVNASDEIDQQRQRYSIGIVSGWILSVGTILTCVYGLIPFLNENLEFEMNPSMSITFGTFSRIGWAIAVGWIIFACLSGYGGFVNKILSWKGFIPLGRLSYVAYLVHYDFIKVYYINKTPLNFTKMNLIMNYLVVLMVSFMLAFIFSIVIEMPFVNLDRYFMGRKPK